MDVQSLFEWTFGPKKRVMRALRFPGYLEVQEGRQKRKVSGDVLKAVLVAIEDHAEGGDGWSTCSPETLAHESHKSVTQVKRAILLLDREGLIINLSKRGVGSKHRPNWDGLLYYPYSNLTQSQREEIETELLREHRAVPNRHTERQSSKSPDRGFAAESERQTNPLGDVSKSPEQRNKSPVEGLCKSPPQGPRSIDIDEVNLSKIDNRYRNIDHKLDFDFAVELLDRAGSVFDLRAPDDWDLFAKLAYLTATGQIPEDWYSDALGLSKRFNGGIGYFMNEIKKRFGMDKKQMGQMLLKIWLPTELEFQKEEVK